MAIDYHVKGADGKEYGPATLDQLSEWVKQGRVPAQQQVRRSDMEYWAAAGEFQELQPFYASAATAVAVESVPLSGAATASVSPQVKSAGAWFYWVAGLSLVNSISAFSGSDWRFILGLGITQMFDAIGANMASGGKMIALLLDLVAAGVFVFFGVFAQKAHLWAFIVGMVFFALDGIIFVIAQDWLGVGFHVFVLYCLFRGIVACRACRP